VLALGTIEPRKNYARLIRAFDLARQDPAGPKKLVIAGRRGWMYDDVFDTVDQLGLSRHVRFLDFVAEDEIVPLYQAAAVFAMPSLYEGFGIPIVEAMACGTPVVCSDAGALPEIAGDAAIVVAPSDIDALAAALVRAVSDNDLRATLIARGLLRRQDFTWEQSARQHLALYHNAPS